MQRSQFAGELQNEAIRLGEPQPEDSSSFGGSLHRAWINLKSAITSQDDHAILAECERGEDSAVNEYKKAMEKERLRFVRPLPPIRGVKARTTGCGICATRRRKASSLPKAFDRRNAVSHSACCLSRSSYRFAMSRLLALWLTIALAGHVSMPLTPRRRHRGNCITAFTTTDRRRTSTMSRRPTCRSTKKPSGKNGVGFLFRQLV